MKKLFENWRKHINESVIDHIQYDVEDLADEGMNAKQIFNNLMSRRDDLQGKDQEVKAAIAKLLNIGPQSIEDETGQARLQEAEYEPDRAVADIDTGEERMSPEALQREEFEDLADKFNVKLEFAMRRGELIAKVTMEDGEVMHYSDPEDMYRDLAKQYEMSDEMDEFEQPHDIELSFEDSNRFVEAYNIIGKAVESGTLPESVEDAVFDMLGKLGINL